MYSVHHSFSDMLELDGRILIAQEGREASHGNISTRKWEIDSDSYFVLGNEV